MGRFITKPIDKLNASAKRMAGLDFSAPCDLVAKFLALGQEKPLLFHVLFKLRVCVLQPGKGLLQIFGQSVQTRRWKARQQD